MNLTVSDKLIVSILRNNSEEYFLRVRNAWLDKSEMNRFKFVEKYYRDNGELPGVRTFASNYGFDTSEVDSKPSVYFEKLKDRYIFTRVAEDIPPLLRRVKDEPREVLKEITTFIGDSNFGEYTSTDTYYSDEVDKRFETYQKRKLTGGVTYLSSGHKLFDQIFFGYQKNDLITFGGRAGSKKTWLLCFLAVLLDDWLNSLTEEQREAFGDILFVTNEMSDEQIKERMDCIRFNLPYQEYLGGKLNTRLEQRYQRGLAGLKTRKSNIRFIYNCSTLNELEVKIKVYRPCSVFVDGSYLMEPQLKEGWEKIVYITRNLKQMTKTHHVPVLNTTQLKRASGKNEKQTSFDAQDEFAYGGSYVQDSDLAIRMFVDKEMIMNESVGLQVAKGRQVNPDSEINFVAPLGSMDFDFVIANDYDSGLSNVQPPEIMSI